MQELRFALEELFGWRCGRCGGSGYTSRLHRSTERCINEPYAFPHCAAFEEVKRDLLEILDDRYDRKSTLITSQLPVDHWHAYLTDPTLADAILDRLVHNSYRLRLNGASMRKQKSVAADRKS